MNRTVARPVFLAVGLSLALPLAAQNQPSAFVDENGVLRWTASNEEVAHFGVNYTTPFAHAFRAHHRLGVSLEAAIDADVYHLARLGLDAYRIHVWDREISDPDGNLVINDHVRAFDYLLAKLKERGIKIILTPLQFGNAAYPEDGVALEGFTSRYGKQGSLENKESWPLQERYLSQFVSHVNPHTGIAYKDDPDIIAFEICNEPGHFEYQLTIDYINRMVRSIRDTGCAKPIFYNMSHGIPVHQAYLDANVQGGTFQWYPANLVAGHEQWGNILPYVDDYPIPFADNPKFQRKAKMVYEFDAADIGRSYIYPAIARTYRKAGMQFAAMFAYDPLYIAPFNTEYQTHYMNLAYAPHKALGLMVAAEAFRRVPLHADYGPYPDNTDFADIHISYPEDLAELITEESFLYSNATTSVPPAPEQLVRVAGHGSSSVVNYPGTGAYFLDRLSPGVWRLEVMPDAIWVRDPYEVPNPTKHVSRLAWNQWAMQIKLPDLGSDFTAAGLNDGNSFIDQANRGTLQIRPGAYLLTRRGVSSDWSRDDRWHNITLKEFVAPPASLDKTYVLHEPVTEATAGTDLQITATIASPAAINDVVLVAYLPEPPMAARTTEDEPTHVQPGGGNTPGTGERDIGGARRFRMQHVEGLTYAVTIPASEIHPGTLHYDIAVQGPDGFTSFPSEIKTFPTSWDFYGEGWTGRIVPASAPILLFDAAEDANVVTADYRNVRYDLVPSDRPGITAMNMVAEELSAPEHDHSFRYFFSRKVNYRRSDLAGERSMVLYGKSATARPVQLQLSLITEDGIAYGAPVTIPPDFGRWAVSIDDLRQVRLPNIPHGYPVFIPFWSSIEKAVPLDLTKVESVLVSIGPGIPADEYVQPHGVQIERIWLE